MNTPTNPPSPLDNDPYQHEYNRLLQHYARLAAADPAMIPQLRASLKLSVQLMAPDRPEAKTAFVTIVDQVDAFLAACQAGDIDPKPFVAAAMKPD